MYSHFFPTKLLARFIKMAMRVMLTLIQEKRLRHYFYCCHYTDILIALQSKNFSIGNFVKISLAILCRHLDHNKAAKSLELTPSDTGAILKVLSNQVLFNGEEKEPWHMLSKRGLILVLKGFCLVRDNCLEFVRQGGLSVLSSILDSTVAGSKEATLLLLWQLSYCMWPAMMGKEGHDLVGKIRHLSSVEGSELFALKICVPFCLLRALPESKLHYIYSIGGHTENAPYWGSHYNGGHIENGGRTENAL